MKEKLEKLPDNGYQLIVGVISIEITNPNDGDYTYQIKLIDNDKTIEEKKNPTSFKKVLNTAEAHKFNQSIKNKSNYTIEISVNNENKQIGSISIPMNDVADERINSDNVIREEKLMNGEEKVAIIKMRLALRKNRFLKNFTDEQMLDKIQNSAAERLESVKSIEKRDSMDMSSIFPTKLNPPRKSLYQIEIDAIEQKLQTVQQGSDVYKKLTKEKKFQEKKEKKRIEKNEKVLKLYNLPKEESLLTRYFAGHVTNKTTWMSRVGNFYLTQNYLCFKQQLVSFMMTIPLFSIKKCVIKSRTINFEFNGNEFVIFERGLSKRMIKVIEEQLNSYNTSENRPLVEHKSSLVENPKDDIYLQDKSNGNNTIEISEEKDDISTTDSEDVEFDNMLSKEPTHVAFIPDDILETVVENREFNVTAVKFFYILFGDQSTFFQDFLIYKGGSSEMVTSKWGNRENEIGSWRQLDYIAPVPPLPLCPTTTRTNRTQYFHLTKEKLIFEERLSMFDVYFGEKFQVGNRIVAITNGKKCLVTVKTGVIFLSKVWGFKSTIVNNSRKSGGGEMRNLLDSAQNAIEEYNNKKQEKDRRRTVTLIEPLPNNNSSSSTQRIDSNSSPNKSLKDDLEQLEKKLSLVTKELELTKTKIAELKKATDPLYQRLFSLVVVLVLLYLLFKQNLF